MSTAQELYTHVLLGHSVSIGMDLAGNHAVKITGIGFRGKSAELSLSPGEYPEMKRALAAAVCSRASKGVRISFYMDFYGRQWIDLRHTIPLPLQRRQRLLLPAEVIDEIKNRIRAQRKSRGADDDMAGESNDRLTA